MYAYRREPEKVLFLSDIAHLSIYDREKKVKRGGVACRI